MFETATRSRLTIGASVIAAFAVLAAVSNIMGTRTASFARARPEEPARAVLVSRTITFRDEPSGGISVWDESAAKPYTVLVRAENNFLASCLRLLVVERVRLNSDEAKDKPFVLTRWNDGGLTLRDTATGHELELNAFGSTNAQSFAVLLPSQAQEILRR